MILHETKKDDTRQSKVVPFNFASDQATTVAIMSKGKWIDCPAIVVDGRYVAVRGRWMKHAFVFQEARQEKDIADPDVVVRKLREAGPKAVRADLFTFSQSLPDTVPRYGYYHEWDSVAAIPLTTFETWWSALPQTARKNVRRAAKRGVAISIASFDDDLVRAIKEINDASPVRQGKANYHFGKSLDAVKRESESYLDRSDFIVASIGDEAIGFLKLVYHGQSASILNLAVKPQHYDTKAVNCLVTRAVELCTERRCSHLIYGKFAYGKKSTGSLLDFKRTLGFEEILVPRYYVPINLRGRILLATGFHKGILPRVPSPVFSAFNQVRSAFYALRPLLRK